MSNRLYLVTGAAGFLGSNICAQLIERGDKAQRKRIDITNKTITTSEKRSTIIFVFLFSYNNIRFKAESYYSA